MYYSLYFRVTCKIELKLPSYGGNCFWVSYTTTWVNSHTSTNDTLLRTHENLSWVYDSETIDWLHMVSSSWSLRVFRLKLSWTVFIFLLSGTVLGLSANFAKIFLPNQHRTTPSSLLWYSDPHTYQMTSSSWPSSLHLSLSSCLFLCEHLCRCPLEPIL